MTRHRGVISGRRWPSGGALTLIVWREGAWVVLSHEGATRTTARLTTTDAASLARLLMTAAEAEPDGGGCR